MSLIYIYIYIYMYRGFNIYICDNTLISNYKNSFYVNLFFLQFDHVFHSYAILISRPRPYYVELYDFCIKEMIADKNLIAKWKKQGYENLCCLRCIQTRDTNFTTNCICRVPKTKLEEVSRSLSACTTCMALGSILVYLDVTL